MLTQATKLSVTAHSRGYPVCPNLVQQAFIM